MRTHKPITEQEKNFLIDIGEFAIPENHCDACRRIEEINNVYAPWLSLCFSKLKVLKLNEQSRRYVALREAAIEKKLPTVMSHVSDEEKLELLRIVKSALGDETFLKLGVKSFKKFAAALGISDVKPVTFKIICPHCSQAQRVPQESAGKQVSCPSCGKPCDVPRPPRGYYADVTQNQVETAKSYGIVVEPGMFRGQLNNLIAKAQAEFQKNPPIAELKSWDFSDSVLNSAVGLINRQKSALNLIVLEIDREKKSAVFFDAVKNIKSTATLSRCDCSDFNLVAGVSPKRVFTPCMHIYRLAMDLGLLEPKYKDYLARVGSSSQLSKAETKRLQALPLVDTEWGSWNKAIHESGIQKNRQYRAYSIVKEAGGWLPQEDECWIVNEHRTTLSSCDCGDFCDRKLPCKHVYSVAIVSEIPLPLSIEEYEAAKSEGRELYFTYEDE